MSAVLGVLGIWAAWLPAETRPVTAVVVAAVILALCTWGWRRSPRPTVVGLAVCAIVGVALAASGLSGWDPARAVGVLGLGAAVVGLAWLASRSRPPAEHVTWFALGLAALALWGVWQVTAGREALVGAVASMPEASRAYALERISSGRAYASLPLPSHLAVLLATALPLLVARIRTTRLGMVAAAGACLALLGLALTRSPVGIGLALVAVAAVVLGRRQRAAVVVVVLLAVVLVAVVAMRSDVTRLEPVALRLDNWRTALWLWSTAPSDGAGLASFAQATQAVPLDLGNRPAHAHNLVLECLAELGPAGLVGCLVLGFWLLRLVTRLWKHDRALAVALVVVPAHNLVDFSFVVSGVALPWAVLLGWGASATVRPVIAAREARGRALVVVAAVAGVALSILHATAVVVERAAASSPHPAERFEGALRSLEIAPWRVEPQFLLAAAALDTGDPTFRDRAWNELVDRRWWRPRSGALAERRARLALARGDVSSAVAELWEALEFGATDPDRERTMTELLTSLDGMAGEQGE